jgi:23S rRNA (adenine-N6)-dimethyltransferase
MSRHHPTSPVGGPHELGQNDLVDRRTIARIVHLAGADEATGDTDPSTARTRPLIEWGSGTGALSVPLAASGRPYVGLELDPRRAARLRERLASGRSPVPQVLEEDILHHAPPAGSTVVGNVPFHLTTPVLRHLFHEDGWQRAVLLLQWEVARKRSGVGGGTRMTAEVWPWFRMSLDRRVPARAFRPVPSVDGGILVLERRRRPLVADSRRGNYRRFVHAVFAGRGRGVADIIARAGYMSRDRARGLCSELGIPSRALPRDLDARQWAGLFDGSGGGIR